MTFTFDNFVSLSIRMMKTNIVKCLQNTQLKTNTVNTKF